MTILEKKTVWQSDSWRLYEYKIETPSGQVVKKGAVDHPGSVVLIPVRMAKEGYEVLMLRQYRAALGQTILELPAGTRGWGEAALPCAQRELREETGFRADKFVLLSETWPSPGSSNEVMSLYLATGLTEDPLPGDVDEVIEVVPMPLDELVEMAQNGRLADGKSVVGLLQTAVYLQKHKL
ncbi:MAG: NUDIX hydrolase [Chloroflexota bacterium]